MLSFLLRRRSVPGFTAVGIDPDGVALVRVVAGEARPRVTLWAYQPIDEGQTPGTVLTELSREYALERTPCSTLIDNRDYKLLLTEAPNVPDEELRDAVRWRVKDLVDFDVQHATLDIFDLPGGKSQAQSRQLYVVIAPHQAVKQRIELCMQAGIDLQVIDIPEMAQRNLAALVPQDAQGLITLSMQPNSGLITVTRGGEILLSRTTSMGRASLDGDGTLALAYEQVVLEIQRSLDFLESHLRQAPPRHLLLGPELAEYDSLHRHLAYSLGIEVHTMDLLSLLEWDSPPPPALVVRCASTLGAALRH